MNVNSQESHGRFDVLWGGQSVAHCQKDCVVTNIMSQFGLSICGRRLERANQDMVGQ